MAGTEANTHNATLEATLHPASGGQAAGLCPEGSTGTGPYPEETNTSRRWQRRLAHLAPWLLVAAGLLLLAWPIITDWMYAWEAEGAITEITSVYNDMSDPERLENLAQAEAYNAGLRGEAVDLDLWDYAYQLTFKSVPESMMAYIEIPKLGLRLPIYHGTSDAALSAGVGHCDWSALPVGGKGNRCVLTAHSGMQNTRMFDDIRRLTNGDVFVVWALGEPHAYRVCETAVILLEELDRLAAEPGRDLTTLVTCTPFGVNSHRLLVTGERCEYDPAQDGAVDPVAPYVNRRTLPFLVGLVALLGLAGLLGVRRAQSCAHAYVALRVPCGYVCVLRLGWGRLFRRHSTIRKRDAAC